MSDPNDISTDAGGFTPSRIDAALANADMTLAALTEAGGFINPAIPGAALIADKLLHIIQAAVRAHEAATGTPLDMSLLHHIEPLPETDDGG